MVKKKSARKPKVKDSLDITDELIAERRTSLKMPKDMTLDGPYNRIYRCKML